MSSEQQAQKPKPQAPEGKSKTIEKQIAKVSKAHGDPPAVRPAPVIPMEIQRILGKPPLFAGESENDFNNLLSRMAVDLRPKDVIEWIWIHNLTVLAWEVLRLRKLRASMLREAQQKELQKALHNAMAPRTKNATFEQIQQTAAQYARDYVAGYDVHEVVAEFFSGTPYSADSVTAKVFVAHLEQVERIERMIGTVMARHDAILREIDRRQESFARRARQVSKGIIDADLADDEDP
jgi:hypothetical protein